MDILHCITCNEAQNSSCNRKKKIENPKQREIRNHIIINERSYHNKDYGLNQAGSTKTIKCSLFLTVIADKRFNKRINRKQNRCNVKGVWNILIKQ